MSVAAAVRREREAFAGTAQETDPDGPTLCEGWRVRDLLAHLVIRDRRAPTPRPGIFVPGLAVWTGAVQQRLARRDPAELVETVRHGPPPYVPAAYPPMDRIDLLEYFVITAEVGELVLHTVGRSAARVTVDGRPDDVAAVRALDRAI